MLFALHCRIASSCRFVHACAHCTSGSARTHVRTSRGSDASAHAWHCRARNARRRSVAYSALRIRARMALCGSQSAHRALRMKRTYIDEHEACRAWLEPWPDCVRTYEFVALLVEPDQRGKGYASAMLDRICNDADEQCIVLHLYVQAQASCNKHLTDQQLINMYARRAWQIECNIGDSAWMVRYPQCIART